MRQPEQRYPSRWFSAIFESHENVRKEIVQNIIDRNETLVVISMAQTLDVNAFRIRLTSSFIVLLEAKLK